MLGPVGGSAEPSPATAPAPDERTTRKRPALACEEDATLAAGRPDPALFSAEASKGVRAFWCERYDPNGRTTRAGPYLEIEADGSVRTRATYVDSRLAGPVTIRYRDGAVFLEGFLEEGEWSGPLTIFHPNGTPWFEARFDAGHLEGGFRTRYPDGALESETRFQHGREDGLARSFYPTAMGGRLKSEVHVEADQLMGEHRLLDRSGRLVRSNRRGDAPASWSRSASVPAD